MPEPVKLKSTLSLFTGGIDYAGLFPPAGLGMAAAIENYARYLQDEHAWMLGRFVVPLARLEEFSAAAKNHLADAATNQPWRLSGLGGNDVQTDMAALQAFNQQHAGRAVIDALECKTETAEAATSWLTAAPAGLTVFCEVPVNDELPKLLAIISEHEACAKLRTGGVTAAAFPSSAQVARFLRTCADADVPFKATAGLHHPVRSEQQLTYEPDSARAVMHGFLNVFIAAGFAQFGWEENELIEVLEERDPLAFTFDNGGVRWREQDLVLAHLRNTRSLFALSFGSCSFTEPIAELQQLGLLT